MALPSSLLESLNKVQSFTADKFEDVHELGEQITSIRLNPGRNYKPQTTNHKLNPIPWTDYGFYLSERPSFTFDPRFHAGCYYVQEASSMFLEQAVQQTVDLSTPLKVLDLSAAPGGKSTHLQSLISKDSILVSNDVIRSRSNVLKDNIIKWGCQNVVVTNNDPRDFSKLEDYFDLVVVDAPCSGSGLFRKDPGAISEWSENNVALCSKRQQRILADILPALKPGGILVYSTCSYSSEENEQISQWLLQSFPLDHRPLQVNDNWGIVKTPFGCRFWPDKLKGEGFYLDCFQKKGENSGSKKVKFRSSLEHVNLKEEKILNQWIDAAACNLMKYESKVYAWPASLTGDFNYMMAALRVIYSGVFCGEFMREKFIPAHPLAMSSCVASSVPRFELQEADAIRYLQRKSFDFSIQEKGWQLVTHKHFVLGWINVLIGRINNYYPLELRIIKDN